MGHVIVITVFLGALGVISTGFKKYWEQLGLR